MQKTWCSRLESNQRPPPYQGGALPTELRERCISAILRDGQEQTSIHAGRVNYFVHAAMFNGAGDGNRTRTSSLEGYSSTIELLPPVSRFESNCGGGRWIRTTEGMSQQIYSLPPLAAWVSLQGFLFVTSR